ncbi:MAG: glycosyl transferase family 1 [Acidobacteria bacterium]|nr:MAG: glycosyl transferase family 1 [Acidobacteriota bacterium]
MKVAVATTQDLFVRGGGAASHAAGLARALSSLGHEVEVVQIPFDWSSKVDVLRQAYQWRLLDLGEAADLVVTLKFPAFYVRAARKVAWILHQHRPLYDNFDLPEHSAFSSSHPEDIAIRDAVRGWDNRYLGEMRRIFTNSRTVAERLRRFNGLEGEPLYHPPPGAERLFAGPFGDYVLWVGRLEANKRPCLLLDALARTKSPARAVYAGRGPLLESLRAQARGLGLGARVDFRGFVTEEERSALYAGALAVVYAPFHEDLGYVTLEAFLAGKPVITTLDAGGPLEFVRDGVNGSVAADVAGVAAAIDAYAGDRARAAEHGRAGRQTYADTIPTWDEVCAALLASA